MDQNLQEINDALWGVRRSQRYHTARVRFFTKWERILAFLSVISGTSVVVTILSEGPAWISISFATAIAVLQAIDLVVGIGSRARLHSDLSRRFLVLERDYIEHDLGSARLTARRLEIEADEPPALRWLDIICHNELSRSLYGDEANTYRVGWCVRLFSNWCDIAPVKIVRDA